MYVPETHLRKPIIVIIIIDFPAHPHLHYTFWAGVWGGDGGGGLFKAGFSPEKQWGMAGGWGWGGGRAVATAGGT